MTAKEDTQEKLIASIRKTKSAPVKKKVAARRKPAKPAATRQTAKKELIDTVTSSANTSDPFATTSRVWPD